MKPHRLLPRLAVALLACSGLLAQPGQDVQSLDLRVISVLPGGGAVIDRGQRDGLAVGDPVFVRPRGGGTYRGTVQQLGERTAVVEFQDPRFVPEPGTSGEVQVLRKPTTPPVAQPDPPPDQPENPPTQPQDPAWTPDQPLLAQVRPVRPEQRPTAVTGRAYVLGELTGTPGGDLDNSFFRGGTQVTVENPFGRGGVLHADAELDYLTEQNGKSGFDLLARRLSYGSGGTRFEPVRWELGRFLHHGFPEFGIVDGAEWNYRRPNGDRISASIGFLPEPDEDFESFEDFSATLGYEWIADDREELVLAGGFQKTLHQGKNDRDLLVLRGHFLPAEGWQLLGNLWVDFYTSDDALKGRVAEVTQALLSVQRRWRSGNALVLAYSRNKFPEILRNEFLRPLAQQIGSDHVDRLSLDGTWQTSPATRWRGRVTGWLDEDEDGVAAELGCERVGFWCYGGDAELSVFGNQARFASVVGARLGGVWRCADGRFDALYEIANHHLDGFTADRDDLLQHRLRISRAWFTASGWDLSLHAEGQLWDEEVAWSIGCYLQRRF